MIELLPEVATTPGGLLLDALWTVLYVCIGHQTLYNLKYDRPVRTAGFAANDASQ